MNNLDTVAQLYAALNEDEVTGFLGLCAADAEVHYPGEGRLAYGGTWRGREAIGRFLETHDGAEEILVFDPGEMVAAGPTVVVLGYFEGRARETGTTWSTKFVHVMTVEDGRLQRWEGFFDTAAAVDAHTASPGAVTEGREAKPG